MMNSVRDNVKAARPGLEPAPAQHRVERQRLEGVVQRQDTAGRQGAHRAHDIRERLLPVLHYALQPGGYLFLGPSETIGRGSKLFDPVDSAAYWCTETASGFGPDGNPVRPDVCDGTRDCCKH